MRRFGGGLPAKVRVDGQRPSLRRFGANAGRSTDELFTWGGGGAVGDHGVLRAAMKCKGASGAMEC